MIKISIIVTVYNIEKYISHCIESLLNQNYSEYEILLIDDGSTDRSAQICDDYSKKYKNIKTYHKENGGVSDARNIGIINAVGRYLLFVDGDDFIAENSLLYLVENLKKFPKTQVMFLEAFKYYINQAPISLKEGYCCEKINGQSKEKVIKHLSELPKLPGSAWGKLVERNFIIKNNLFFEKGVVSTEDIRWSIHLIKNAEYFSYCPTDFYYYRQERKDSVTKNIKMRNVICIIDTIKKECSKDLSKPFQREINSLMAYEYVMALYSLNFLNNSDKKIVMNKLRSCSWVLDYSNTFKTKLVRKVESIFGVGITSRLLYYWCKFRNE